ncbi:isoprenylcysteine carboxyl methyltransferase family protein [Paracoccus benzoatiresistens]|uniref:Isoprenylcysteine carboxylmethyltransferase family protein n=1 Tax=Paracoccus benzoatiresistens TaxID=2997341 RepID=A0ABT4J0N7_9RHOB|nr:isoprenylcysteine carboxylmethyltransferase family protein [Paracoccus sp. EF6]MCZ0960681.1 isoprenylcysteine carboxylmethyltransferase family protein [Paracoccus sp. EF6]
MAEVYPATLAFIAFLLLQRGAELILARHNTRRLLDRGAVEHGAGHYALIVILHAAWLLAICVWGWSRPVSPGWLALFAVLQLCRFWVLASLGPRWTTRIIVLDEPLVRRGPYRWMAHPNYAVVVAEIFVAPMVLGLWPVALVFSILNAAVLSIRIRAEARALGRGRAGA